MKTERRFLIAPSLARLVRRDHSSSERIAEGYFPPHPGRTQLVRIEAAHCRLVLISTGSEKAEAENETELPRSQAEALLEVCGGRVAFVRTPVHLESGEVYLDHLVVPGPLDLLTVAFDSPGEAHAFSAAAWFGREVSGEPAYEWGAFALKGLPPAEEVPLSDVMLDAYLDAREGRSRADRLQSRADQAISRPSSTSRTSPVEPTAARRPSADPDQGQAVRDQARVAQDYRLKGTAAVLARIPRAPNVSTQRERPPGSISERPGWRARQFEQQT